MPQPRKSCRSDGRARSARGEVAGRAGPSVAQRRGMKLGRVRPSAWSVHCCSKVSRCCWITWNSAVFSGSRRAYVYPVADFAHAAAAVEGKKRQLRGLCVLAAAVATQPCQRRAAAHRLQLGGGPGMAASRVRAESGMSVQRGARARGTTPGQRRPRQGRASASTKPSGKVSRSPGLTSRS